jgi:hypothetical protein
MAEITYLKDYKRSSGRIVPKGTRAHVTHEHASQLVDAGFAKILSFESNRSTQAKSEQLIKAIPNKETTKTKTTAKEATSKA